MCTVNKWMNGCVLSVSTHPFIHLLTVHIHVSLSVNERWICTVSQWKMDMYCQSMKHGCVLSVNETWMCTVSQWNMDMYCQSIKALSSKCYHQTHLTRSFLTQKKNSVFKLVTSLCSTDIKACFRQTVQHLHVLKPSCLSTPIQSHTFSMSLSSKA